LSPLVGFFGLGTLTTTFALWKSDLVTPTDGDRLILLVAGICGVSATIVGTIFLGTCAGKIGAGLGIFSLLLVLLLVFVADEVTTDPAVLDNRVDRATQIEQELPKVPMPGEQERAQEPLSIGP